MQLCVPVCAGLMGVHMKNKHAVQCPFSGQSQCPLLRPQGLGFPPQNLVVLSLWLSVVGTRGPPASRWVGHGLVLMGLPGSRCPLVPPPRRRTPFAATGSPAVQNVPSSLFGQ